jgi:hypothetical protein
VKPSLKEQPFAEGTQYNYRLGLDLMHKLGLTEMPFSELTTKRAKLYIAKLDNADAKHEAARIAKRRSGLKVV